MKSNADDPMEKMKNASVVKMKAVRARPRPFFDCFLEGRFSSVSMLLVIMVLLSDSGKLITVGIRFPEYRQSELEFTELVHGTAYGDVSAVKLNDSLDDEKTESHSVFIDIS